MLQAMATLREVAEAAGVSKAVASRALTGDFTTRMSEETRRRVRAVAEKLQYVPNHRSRALRFARSGAVGLIVPDVNNAVFAEMLAGVQDRARDAAMSVLLGQIDPPPPGATSCAAWSAKAGSTGFSCNVVRISAIRACVRCSPGIRRWC